MKASAITGERYLWKVGALFPTQPEARLARDTLAAELHLAPDQIRLIAPRDDNQSKKLEPESRGIARTLVRSHVTLGLSGALAGALLAGILLWADVRVFEANPWITLGWMTAFGAVAGMLLAGFVALRPDHDPLNLKIEEATRDGGCWAVVVHLRDHDTEQPARELLERMSGEVISTL